MVNCGFERYVGGGLHNAAIDGVKNRVWQVWLCERAASDASKNKVQTLRGTLQKMSMPNRATGKTTKHTLDADTPLSANEQAMLVRLAAMPDSDIDFSDIPPSPRGAKWTRPGIPRAVIAPQRKRRD